MSNDEGMTKSEELFGIRIFELISSFVIRISSFLLLPCGENLRFAFSRETSFRMRLSVRRQGFEPGERIARSNVQWPKRQALAYRATDVRSPNRIIFPRPHRHVRPGLHFLLSQKFLFYPGKLRV